MSPIFEIPIVSKIMVTRNAIQVDFDVSARKPNFSTENVDEHGAIGVQSLHPRWRGQGNALATTATTYVLHGIFEEYKIHGSVGLVVFPQGILEYAGHGVEGSHLEENV